MNGDTIFDVNEHLEYRKKRYHNADINNKKLLGLSTVEINPTELCNRTCSFCPRSDPNVYPNRNLNMTIHTAENISNQLLEANFTGDIHITGFGEPTLNPDILGIIKAFSNNFFTEMITNGDRLITGKLKHNQLSENGLNSLIVDCYDGPDQTQNIKDLLKDFVGQKRIRNHYDTGESNLFELYNYNNRGGTINVKQFETMDRQCYMPMYKAFIDWNGDVLLCCNDWARKQKSFGNVNKDTFSDIWMNNMFTEVRKTLLKGHRYLLPACKRCDTDGCKGGSDSAVLWK